MRQLRGFQAFLLPTTSSSALFDKKLQKIFELMKFRKLSLSEPAGPNSRTRFARFKQSLLPLLIHFFVISKDYSAQSLSAGSLRAKISFQNRYQQYPTINFGQFLFFLALLICPCLMCRRLINFYFFKYSASAFYIYYIILSIDAYNQIMEMFCLTLDVAL